MKTQPERSASEVTVALWTAPGRAALATLVLAGPDAWGHLQTRFRPVAGPLPKALEAGVWVGSLGDEALADQVVVGVHPDRDSRIEIHCHGGPEVVRLLMETFAKRGVRVVPWQEQLTGPEWQRLLHERLCHAPTARTANTLLEQLSAWPAFLARLSAALDRRSSEARDIVGACLRWDALGRHLVDPWRVVLAGAPNVGKSSLINALAGYERSVVAALPGTTRDVVRVATVFDGWPVELSDTAGFRAASDELEAEGTRRAAAEVAGSDLCLWVVESAAAPLWPPAVEAPMLVVVNKMDLAPVWDLQPPAGMESLRVSAKTGEGMEALRQRIIERLMLEISAKGEALPFAVEVAQVLHRVAAAVDTDDWDGARRALRELD